MAVIEFAGFCGLLWPFDVPHLDQDRREVDALQDTSALRPNGNGYTPTKAGSSSPKGVAAVGAMSLHKHPFSTFGSRMTHEPSEPLLPRPNEPTPREQYLRTNFPTAWRDCTAGSIMSILENRTRPSAIHVEATSMLTRQS